MLKRYYTAFLYFLIIHVWISVCAQKDHMYYYVAMSSVLVQTATRHYYMGCVCGFLTTSHSFICQRKSSRSQTWILVDYTGHCLLCHN